MLMGRRRQSSLPRLAIQSLSCHWWVRVQTLEAEWGGVSAWMATGSALRVSWPVTLERMKYLYPAPWPSPSTKVSQMPEAPLGRMGVARVSQALKSPTRWTSWAEGAQTAKLTPARPSRWVACAPSLSARSAWVPSLKRKRSSWESDGWMVGMLFLGAWYSCRGR